MQLFTLLTLLPLLAFADPFWIVQLAPLVSTRLDPVVTPGGVSGHVHAIIGGSAFSPTYDYTALRTSKCTTANVRVDLSNYWQPQMYRKVSGGVQLVPNEFNNVYYFMRRNNKEPVYEFPPGFRMLAGNPNRVTFTKGDSTNEAVSYVCLDYKGGSSEGNAFPTKSCPDGLRAQVFFPSCWDGVNNWLEGSKHVTYGEGNYNGGGKCPASHPKRIMALFYEFVFKDNYTYQPGARVLANGDTTGYGLHADFTNGWPEGFFQKIFDQGETCNVQFSLEKCPPLAAEMVRDNACAPEKVVVNEDIGAKSILPRLPGNNPFYGVEGPKRPSYTETAKFKAIGPSLPSNWKMLGCIPEASSGRALDAARTATDDMTPVKCMQFCASKGYKLAGIEWSRECYCANSLSGGVSETPDGKAKFAMECSGEAQSKGYCGGSRTLTLYKFNGTGAPTVVGGGGSGSVIEPTPQSITQVKATTIRKCTVKGDPTYPSGNQVINLTRRSRQA